MRFYVLRALVQKEVRRHLANRGGLALAGLLVVAALLLSVFNPTAVDAGAGGGELVGGVHHCYVEYASETPFVAAMRAKVPPALRDAVQFRLQPPDQITSPPTYEPGTAAIRISETTRDGPPRLGFDVWHPPGQAGAVAPYEAWFFRAAHEVMRERASAALGGSKAIPAPALRDDDLWAVDDSFRALAAEVARRNPSAPLPAVEIHRFGIGPQTLDYRSAVATAMVVFALYFACCYLLPTLNCEERERGVLLAQALSPASPAELVAAKFLFYPVLGILLAATLAGIYSPPVLGSLFFWLALLALGGGFLGVGMTVSTLAKTQRAAFMGSMCYLLAVSLLLFVCSQSHVPLVSNLFIEFHGPKILFAAMTRTAGPDEWYHLLAAFALAAGWMTLAAWLFRRRGWQ